MQITKTIEWDMGHRIPNHSSKCKNLHGHRYKLEVFLDGDLVTEKGNSSEDMVVDFGEVKSILIQEVDEVCDHVFMVYQKDAVMIDFFKKNMELKHIVVPFIPTAEQIAHWLFEKLDKAVVAKCGTKLKLVSVRLWETPTCSAIFFRNQ